MPKAVFVKRKINGYTEFRFLYDQEGVDIMRQLPLMSRTWMPDQKCWTVFVKEDAEIAISMFNMLHWVVNISDEIQDQEQRRSRAREERERAQERESANRRGPNFRAGGPTLDETHYEEVITAFFRLVPYDRRDELYKAIVKFFHPDTGGDETKMKMLNKVAGR